MAKKENKSNVLKTITTLFALTSLAVAFRKYLTKPFSFLSKKK